MLKEIAHKTKVFPFQLTHSYTTLQADTGTTHLQAEDYMDDGTCIKVCIDIDESEGTAVFDFTGTGPQVIHAQLPNYKN